MTTVRQTVTTVQNQQGQLDNSLDALLEDLQTSVSGTMNGYGGSGNRSYREVTRTVQQESVPREYRVTRTVQQETVPQVQYLSAANPTTVVQERAASPMNPGEQRSVTAYKTVSYQYKTSDSQPSVPVVGNKILKTKSASDERLQQNLTELDSLLVDLHQAQKTGFGSPQGGSTTTTRTEVVTTGIDPGLLEPVNHSTPAPPARQQQHISRSVQYKYNTQHYDADTSSPRLQPKRSSSANRDFSYGSHDRSTRSPSPMRLHKDTYYENKSRSQTMPPERYRDKSPTNERLRRELFYESKTARSVSPTPRYRDISPPSQRRGTSPVPPVQTISSSPEPYPSQPGGGSRITTVRTYNYSTNTSSNPPPASRSPYPSISPSPKAPYPETVTVTELAPSPHRSPPAASPEGYPPPLQTLPPGVLPYPPPPPQIPGQPPTKVITTVHTYTYEIPGQPGVNSPYPPPGTTTTTYVNSLPPDAPDYPGTRDRTLTYHVSPQLPREKEPLLPQQSSTDPLQPPTVITYKYSTHHSSHTSNKYPGGPPPPEEQQPLLPRPFPTSSPPPGQPAEGQPPKRLDDLMASFGDPKEPVSPPSYYKTEKTVTTTTTRHPHEGNGVAIVPSAVSNSKSIEKEKSVLKERERTVNKPGPPVYYPPGVEMFARKEESMMTQGSKKASASGKYKYESESKSKSSSGGGAAVVPVCLPLCCAMPCVIL